MAFGKNTNAAPAATPASTPAAGPSKYAQMATASVTHRNDKIGPGHYLLRVDSIRRKQTRNAGAMILPIFTVVHVFPDAAISLNALSQKFNDKVTMLGSEVGDPLFETDDTFMSRFRGILDAAGPLTQEDWNVEGGDKIVNEATGEGQPLTGNVVEVRAVRVVNKKATDKAQADLVPADTYIRSDYVRNVDEAAVRAIIGEEAFAKFFPA